MFGRGKASEKTPSKPKKSSGASFAWKTMLLNHVEKIAMGIFLAFTGYLVYEGLLAGKFETSKSPEELALQAQKARTEIETGAHWNVIKAERPMPNDFVKLVDDARKDMDAAPYVIVNIPERVSNVSGGEKRGDPELFAPIEVKAASFFGSIAVFSPKPAKADELPNAPPVGDGKRPRKPPTATTPPRNLIPAYDVGFQPKPGAAPAIAAPTMGRLGRPVESKVVPKLTYFNVVTAAVPHELMADSYKKAFASATAYFPDRDSPNYLGYEVQRVDVTDNPERAIDESEWKEATSCSLDSQLKEKNSWVGTCDEISLANYIVDQILTMPIPPILLSDYRPLFSHPLIPRLDLVRKTASAGDSTEPMDDSEPTDDGTSPDDSSGDSGMPSASAAEDPKNIPKQLEITDYKLLRFVDFDVKLDRMYRYRVRLALEDPNYTRAKGFSPKTSDMKPEVVARVQVLEAADADALSKLAPGQKLVRNSKLQTLWSEASTPVVTRKPTELYSGKASGNWVQMKTPNGKAEVAVEIMPLKATLVYAEWAEELSLLVSQRKNDIERGTVLSGVPYVGTAVEPGLDAIHPISKVIKWVKDFKFANPVTIADIRGGQPLAAEKRSKEKDPLPSGGEVVAYDPRTGELIVSREFEATVPYQMLGFTDERPADDR
jgi:hypothetical protein